jgi:acyl carrier protein
MNQDVFLENLTDLFELEPGEITGESVLQEISGWDSLTFLGLIALVDENYGIALAPQQVLACHTINDLIGLIKGGDSASRAA